MSDKENRNQPQALPRPSGVKEGREISTERRRARSERTPQASSGQPSHTQAPASARKRKSPRTAPTAVACLLMLLCLIAAFASAARLAVGQGATDISWTSLRIGACRFLLAAGLPKTGEPVWSAWLDAPLGAESDTLPATQSDTDPVTGTAIEPTQDSTASGKAESPVLVPVVSLDMSESERGADYVVRDEGCTAEADFQPWPTGQAPRVLLVHTHPFEAFGDGESAYMPAEDGWALSEDADSERNIVALGIGLAERLRAQGMTVIHVTADMAGIRQGASYQETFAQAEAQVAYWREQYPDIDLVIDLRRSAELAAEGILRTAGTWDGSPCAQVRLVVDADRTDGAVARSLGLALAVRGHLWAVAPELSRPVWLRSTQGLSTAEDALILTVELGAAGNTFEEAEALLAPLADAIAGAVRGG